MKRISVLILIIVFSLTCFTIPIHARNESTSIIVEYKTSNNTVRNNIYKKGLGSVNKINKIKNINKDLDVIEFSDATAANNAINSLNKDENVLIAELDQKRELMGVNPNDQYFSTYQWGHNYIDATTAWEAVSYQQRRVVVAVIDTGVEASHPDLNGKVLSGYNPVLGNTDTTDMEGHGTLVSGIIAASTNNGIGFAGATGTFDVVILPIKVKRYDEKEILSSAVIAAIIYATTERVDVINISLGGTTPSATEQNAINNAKNAGIVVVASSGNDGNATINYPASYDNVISVASHTLDGSASDFSTYNAYVDISAPGSNISSTYLLNAYATGSGTSFSSPYVAAIAAMIKAVAPSKTTAEVTNILTSSAVKPSGQTGRSDKFGYGYANASAALRLTLGLNYSSTNLSLDYDKVYLGSGLPSIAMNATLNPAYSGGLIWYKNTDTVITTGTDLYSLTKGTASTGSGVVTAKIPLNTTNAATCQYSWTNAYNATSIENSITGVSIVNGMLLGEFDYNKTDYLINVNATDVMPVVTPVLANEYLSYMIKNAKHLNDTTVITIMDSKGSSKSYTFTATVLTENAYPYIVKVDNSATFAVATYKNAEADYTLQMVCAMYNSSTLKLARLEIFTINVLNGYNTYKTSFEVPSGNYVQLMLLNDLINITPYKKAIVYQ